MPVEAGEGAAGDVANDVSAGALGGEADGGEGVAGPGVGAGHVGRAGEAGADVIGEAAGKLHDVGVAEAFIPDARVHGEVNVF